MYLDSLKMCIFFSPADQNSLSGSSLANKYVFTHFIKVGITFPQDWHNSPVLVFYGKLCLYISLEDSWQVRWTTAALAMAAARGAACGDTWGVRVEMEHVDSSGCASRGGGGDVLAVLSAVLKVLKKKKKIKISIKMSGQLQS